MSRLLTIKASPHIKDSASTKKIMWNVVYALIPALIASLVFFGLNALIVSVSAVIFCMIFEFAIQKYLLKGEITICDGSAVITGLLLAFNLPSNLPIWMIAVGSLVAIGVAKMSFGGLGKNPFNPALVGRVFLLISFPVQMTSWPKPNLLDFSTIDVSTGATALGILKEGLLLNHPLTQIWTKIPPYTDLFFGNIGGSLGEVSALALILGGAYLLYKKIITIHIPLSFILTVFVFTGIFYKIDSHSYVSPFFHLLSGGLILGAIFMATDMVTTPMSARGMIVFGIGCGVLTTVIRLFGVYPEGVSFAILIMNSFTPLINKLCKPKRYGANGVR